MTYRFLSHKKAIIYYFAAAFLTLLFLLAPIMGWGQVSINAGSAAYEPFNSFSGGSAPANWDIKGGSTRGTTWNGTNQTGGASGGWYGNNNMSFLGSGSATNGNGTWMLRNTTGAAITSFRVVFEAQLWKNGSSTAGVTVSWTSNGTATAPNAGALTAISALNFSDATTGISAGTTLGATVTGANIANNQYVYLRFIHPGNTNGDNMGWDDVYFIPEPTTQATNVTFSNVAISSMTVNWTSGNGARRAVFVRQATQGTITAPVDGTAYTASANWNSKGTQLGTSGYYCVYNGTGNSVNLTNLTGGTAYWVQVIEYNSDAVPTAITTTYLTNTGTGNPASRTTNAASTLAVSNTGFAQFTTQNLDRNTTSSPVSRFRLDVTNGAATLSSLSFSTTGNNITSSYTQNDITNFNVYYTTGTSFTSPTLIAGAAVQTSGKVLTNSNETITFSGLTQTLAVGTYYIWITADILPGATSGRTITVNAPSLSASVGTVSGSTAATGSQAVVSGTPVNYYLINNTAATASSWNTQPNGSGTALSSLGRQDVNLIVDNETAASIGGDITLGNNSKIIVSQGTTARLIVNGVNLTGTIDVGAAGTLELNMNNTQLSMLTLGTLATGSEVIYTLAGDQILHDGDFYNLTLGGSGTKSLGGNTTIAGTLTLPSGSILDGGNYVVSGTGDLDVQAGATLITANTAGINGFNQTSGGLSSYDPASGYQFNGTSAQVTGNAISHIQDLVVNNPAGVSLSSDLLVDGTLTIADGKLVVGSNILTIGGPFSGSAAHSLTLNGVSIIETDGTTGVLFFDQTSATTKTAGDFVLTSGSVTIGNPLLVTGVVTHTSGTLNSEGNLTLAATGNTTYGQVAGTGSGTINGAISVQMIIPGSASGWRNFSSPVDTATFGQLGTQTQIDFVNTATGPSDSKNVYQWAESNKTWTALTANQNMYHQAYNIYYFDPSNTTLTLSGLYNKGDYNAGALSFNNSGDASADGWHLIANPYPSALDWNSITLPGNMNNQYAVWSETNGNYLPWNGAAGLAGQFIPPMHAYWVKVTAPAAGDFVITSANRVTNTQNHFGLNSDLKNAVKLDVHASQGTNKDQLIIYFDNNKQDNEEKGAYKLPGTATAPQLWSVKDGKNYTIDVYSNEHNTSTIVPVAFKTSVSGRYSIEPSFENMESGVEAWLEDTKTHTWHQLSAGNYSFDYAASESFVARFNIHFKSSSVNVEDYKAHTAIAKIYNAGDGVKIKLPETGVQEKADVIIWNMLGQEVYRNTFSETEFTAYPGTHLSGMYIVEVKTSRGSCAEKIIR